MRRTVFAGKFISLIDEDSWEFAHRPAAAGVVQVIAVDRGGVLLVEQFRASQGARVISLPGGLIAKPTRTKSETSRQAAFRELAEETGYAATYLKRLGSGPASPGMTTESVVFFRAEGLRKTRIRTRDPLEDIALHRVPLMNIRSWLKDTHRTGLLIDLKVFSGLYLANL